LAEKIHTFVAAAITGRVIIPNVGCDEGIINVSTVQPVINVNDWSEFNIDAQGEPHQGIPARRFRVKVELVEEESLCPPTVKNTGSRRPATDVVAPILRS